MVGSIVASRDGEGVFGAFGGYNLHFFLVLQTDGGAFLTGQIQTIQLYLSLAGCLQIELTVIALTLDKERELVVFVETLNIDVGAFHGDFHAVFNRLCHLGL